MTTQDDMNDAIKTLAECSAISPHIAIIANVIKASLIMGNNDTEKLSTFAIKLAKKQIKGYKP